MRICVYGAGAIGGNFAARLAAAGNDVSVVVRGPHLDAIRANGLILHAGDRTIVARVRASDRPADLGPQDAVLVTMKASGQHMLAPSILQDYELGRPMEVEAIVRAPLAFARSASLDTSTLDAIEALCVTLAESKGLYRS